MASGRGSVSCRLFSLLFAVGLAFGDGPGGDGVHSPDLLRLNQDDLLNVGATVTMTDVFNVARLQSKVSTITQIDPCTSTYKGQTFIFLCPASGDMPKFAEGGNLVMAGSANPNFECDADKAISFYCDGTNWIETSRSDSIASALRSSDSEVLINADGLIGGDSAFTYDTGTDILTVADLTLTGVLSCDAENEKLETASGGAVSCGSIASADFWNGTIAESFNALVTESGGVITVDVEQSGGGDLTAQFSSGPVTLDCDGASPNDCEKTLTAGSDTSPQENFVYVLESTGAMTVATSDWPATEHVRVAYLLVPSATFVASNGPYINQNWNDHYQGTDGQGHLSHMGERLRYLHAIYHSGIAGNGDGGTYVARTDAAPDTVYIQSTSGVVMQMHRHTVPAFDSSGTDSFLIPNSSVAAYEQGQDLYDFLVDADGDSMTTNYYNLVLWGAANKSGEYEPFFINLPTCSYNSQTLAESDSDGCDVFTFPAEFDLESSTGYLIARLTMKHSNPNDLELISTVDLRGATPQSATGGASGAQVDFADNQFTIYDEGDVTKIMDFQASGVTTGTTRTMTVPNASGVLALTAQTDGSIDITDLGTGTSAELASVISNETGTGLAVFATDPVMRLATSDLRLHITGDAAASGSIRLFEETLNGTNYQEIFATGAITSNRTCVLADADKMFPDACIDDAIARDSELPGGLEDLETATDDGLVVGNGSTFDTKVVADCDGTGDSLNYDTATNAFSCVTREFASFYEAGTTSVDGTARTLDYDTTQKNSNGSVFTLSGGQVTVDKTGTFAIDYDVTVELSSNNLAAYCDSWLEVDTGGGMSEVTGTRSGSMCNRTGWHIMHTHLVMDVTSGDVFQVIVYRTSGTVAMSTRANASRLSIEEK